MDVVDPSVFLPMLRRKISGPIEQLMKDAIMVAAIQFCRESKYVVDSIAVSPVSLGQLITICFDPDLKSSDIISVVDDSGSLLYGGESYLAISANLIKALQDLEGLTIQYVVEPRPSSVKIPKQLFDDYAEEVACGAAQSLYLKPNAPWANVQLAQFYGVIFTEGYRKASRFRLEQSIDLNINPARSHQFF